METHYPQLNIPPKATTAQEPRLTQTELFKHSEFYPEELESHPTQKAPRFDIKAWWQH